MAEFVYGVCEERNEEYNGPAREFFPDNSIFKAARHNISHPFGRNAVTSLHISLGLDVNEKNSILVNVHRLWTRIDNL